MKMGYTPLKELSKTANQVREAIIKKGFIPITSYVMGREGIGICDHEIFTRKGMFAVTLVTCGGEYVKTYGALGIHYGPRGGVKAFSRI